MLLVWLADKHGDLTADKVEVLMGLGDTFNFYNYGSDDGNGYAVKLSAAVAAAGGFSTEVDPLSYPGWPFGPENLRHVWGLDSSGNRTKLPISSVIDSKYVSGGTFTLHGRTYTVQGAIGEARKLNSLGG